MKSAGDIICKANPYTLEGGVENAFMWLTKSEEYTTRKCYMTMFL